MGSTARGGRGCGLEPARDSSLEMVQAQWHRAGEGVGEMAGLRWRLKTAQARHHRLNGTGWERVQAQANSRWYGRDGMGQERVRDSRGRGDLLLRQTHHSCVQVWEQVAETHGYSVAVGQQI